MMTDTNNHLNQPTTIFSNLLLNDLLSSDNKRFSTLNKISILIHNSTSLSEIYNYLSSVPLKPETTSLIISLFTEIIDTEPELFVLLLPVNNPNFLYEQLINIYLNNLSTINLNQTNSAVSNLQKSILTLISSMLKVCDCNRESYELIYQYLAKYIKGEFNITQNMFDDVLKLLDIFYGANFIEKERSIDSVTNNCNISLPYSYVVHQGSGVLKRECESLNYDKGVSILMWFYIKHSSNDFDKNENSILLEIILKDNTSIVIEVDSKGNSLLIISKDKFDSKPIEKKKWYLLHFNMTGASLFGKHTFVLTLIDISNPTNKGEQIFRFELTKDVSLEIKEMNFYNNFYGLSTSIMILTNVDKWKIPLNLIKENHLKYGAHNAESTQYFMENDDKNDKRKFIGMRLHSLYSPFQYSISNHSLQLKDLINNVNLGIQNLKDNDKPIIITHFKTNNFFVRNVPHVYTKKCSNISFIGGINSLLPIFKLMLDHKDILLSSNSFGTLLNIITNILNTNKVNYIYAIMTDFFELLKDYMENIPKSYYNERIFKYLEQIKILFESYYDHLQSISTNECKTIKNINAYFENIYLNHKIISKFPVNIQEKIIYSIYDLIVNENNSSKQPNRASTFSTISSNTTNTTNDTNNSNIPNKPLPYKLFHKFCHISSLVNFLYVINNKFSSEYCCNKHKDAILNINSNDNNHEQNLKTQLEPFLKLIIYELGNDSNKVEKMVSLGRLLCLDIHTCTQIFIIECFYLFIKELKFVDDEDMKNFELQLKEKMFCHLLLGVFNFGINEVQIKVIELLIELNTKLIGFLEKDDIILLKNLMLEEAECVNRIEALESKRAKSVRKKTRMINKEICSEKKRKSSTPLKKKVKNNKLTVQLINEEISTTLLNNTIKHKEICDQYIKHLNEYIQSYNDDKKMVRNYTYTEKFFVINENIINCYTILMKWISLNKQNSPKIINNVFGIIIALINHSFSFTLLQRFLSDLKNLMRITETTDSCSDKFQSPKLFHFLLETSHHFLIIKTSNFDKSTSPFLLLNKKVKQSTSSILTTLHELLTTIIIFNLKSNSNLLNLAYILSWLTYHRTICDTMKHPYLNIKDLYLFIEQIFQEVIAKYFLRFRTNKIFLDNTSSLKRNNLVLFTNILFDYIVFQKNSILPLTDPTGYLEIKKDCSVLKLPSFLLSWVDMNGNSFQMQTTNKEINKEGNKGTNKFVLQNINKHTLFALLYYRFQGIWDCYSYCDKTIEGTTEIQKKTFKIDRLIEQYVFCNKVNYGKFEKEINFLLYTIDEVDKKNKEQYKTIPLIQIFSHFINISIILNESKEGLAVWIDEYEKFLCFSIIATINIQPLKLENEKKINFSFLQVITFGINFLLEQFRGSAQKFKGIYKDSLHIIFYLIHKIINNKKFHFELSPLYILFNTLLLDKLGRNIILHSKKFDIKLNNFKDIEIIFDSKHFNFWNEALFNNVKINEQLGNYFNKEIVLFNCIKRYCDIVKIIPIYKYELINDLDNTKGLIKTFNLRLFNFYDKCKSLDNMKVFRKNVSEATMTIFKAFYKENDQNFNNMIKQRKYNSKLFKWRGMWSDRQTFYNNTDLFKQKIVNHYSLEFALPLITPILNSDYYLFFGKKSEKYMISFKSFHKIKHELKIKRIVRSEKKFTKRSELWKKSFNGKLFFISNNKKLLYSSEKENIENKQSIFNFRHDSLGNDSVSSDQQNESEENSINNFNNLNGIPSQIPVCLIKETNHIRGIISYKKGIINYMSSDNNEYESMLDKDYFKLSKKCFGSFHQDNVYNYALVKEIHLPIDKIKYIFLRNYCYISCGIEIFTQDNKSYCFHFSNNESRKIFTEKFKNEMKQITIERTNNIIHLLGYYNSTILNNEYDFFTFIFQKWNQEQSISNFAFIMWLNIISNRSYKDITQYPVFPWPIQDVSTNDIERIMKRNYKLPMGMLILNRSGFHRKKRFIRKFVSEQIMEKETDLSRNKLRSSTKRRTSNIIGSEQFEALLEQHNENNTFSLRKKRNDYKFNLHQYLVKMIQTPSYYDDGYSNTNIVSNYLLRIYPYTGMLHNKKYKNEFKSVSSFLKNSLTNPNNISELTPEFFILPELYINVNHDENLSDVKIPDWCENKPYKLTAFFRKLLEHHDKELNSWMDLIFGYKQRESEAENYGNVFSSTSYKEHIQVEDNEAIIKAILYKFYNKGTVPRKLVHEPIQQKQIKELIQITNISSSKDLKVASLPSKMLTNTITWGLPIYIKEKLNDSIIIITSNYIMHIFTIAQGIYDFYMSDIKTLKMNTDKNNQNIPFKMSYLSNYSTSNLPIIIHENNYIIGGYWDGTILNYVDNTSIPNNPSNTKAISLNLLDYDTSSITSSAFDVENKLLIFGTKNGSLLIYSKLHENNNKFLQIINDHSEEVICLTINHTLQIICSSSYDGYCHLYTLPTFKLIRSFKFDDFYADHVHICNFPVPSIVMYCKEINTYKCYTVNGTTIDIYPYEFVDKKNNADIPVDFKKKIVNCYTLFTDSRFNEFLIEGTEDGYIIIREIPELKVRTCIEVFQGNVPIKSINMILNGTGIFVWGNEQKEFKIIFNYGIQDNNNTNII